MSSLHSSRWHRVAGLKPRLSPHLRVRRQTLRGERWIVLADPVSGRSVRLNAGGWALAGRLDGRRTVQQLWDWQLAQLADPATQDEIVDLLAQLREAALLQFDRPADFDLLLPHLTRMARARGRGSLIAWRLRLGSPAALLDRLQPLARRLFTPAAGWAWAAAVLWLAVLALQHAPTLWAHGATWLGTPRFALLATVLYVPVKALHELAHGLAVRRWGGHVRDAGVTLMMLLPVPWVDASAASAFVQRRQRVIVGAAGIMAELALAAAALPLWLWLDDGLLRDAAFVTLVITGISTLVFNGNPLQRLDGYYILTDALDLPNLAPRSRAWWQDLLLRRVLRLPGAEAMPVARGEAPWLAAYAPLSWLYGLGVSLLAVLWLGHVSAPLGLACGAVLGWQLLLRPPWRWWVQLRQGALAQDGSARRWRRLTQAAAAVLALALLLPLPQGTLVQGVVWPPDQAQLRTDEDGFVETVAVADGATVGAGDLVLQLANPDLLARQQRQQSRVAALETELFDALPRQVAAREGRKTELRPADPRAGDARAELAAAQQELARLNDRVAALALRAHAAGRLALPEASDLGGRWLRRGQLLGQVLGSEPPLVRVAVPEAQAQDLRHDAGAVSVRLAAAAATVQAARLEHDGGGAVMELPSAALSARHGGGVQTDPKDAKDLKPLQPVVLLDVRLHPGAAGAERIGERAWVRFETGLAPTVWQLGRAVQRAIAQRFNPQF